MSFCHNEAGTVLNRPEKKKNSKNQLGGMETRSKSRSRQGTDQAFAEHEAVLRESCKQHRSSPSLCSAALQCEWRDGGCSTKSVNCILGGTGSWRWWSQQQFRKARSWREWVDLWTRFYADRMCLPAYSGVWTGRDDSPGEVSTTFEGGDYQKMLDTGKRLAQLSRATGLLFDDGQAGDSKLAQRQYLTGFAPARFQPVLHAVSEEINRIPGLVAFYWAEPVGDPSYQHARRAADDVPHRVRGLVVTYDGGVGFSRLPNMNGAIDSLFHNLIFPTASSDDEGESGDDGGMEEQEEEGADGNDAWMNAELQSALAADGMLAFTLIDTLPDSNRLIPALEDLVQRGALPPA